MALQISGMDLYYLTKEFQVLIGAKVSKIYVLDKKELLIHFHIPKIGKRRMRVKLPNFMYFTEKKIETPEQPNGFCMFLRKRLNNARIRKVEQIGLERILKVTFSTKDHEYVLVFELFSKGNLILCDSDLQIIMPMEWQMWKDRKVKSRVEYVLPKEKIDIRKLSLEEFEALIKKSEKGKLVTFLALELGLGGKYSEYLCNLSDIDKNLHPAELKDASVLHKNLKGLFSRKVNPIIEKNNIFPFGGSDALNFNSGFDSMIEIKQDSEIKKNKKLLKAEKIVENQKEHIVNLQKESEVNNELGELIYSNYQKISELLEQLNQARETMSLQDIKKKLKNKMIKDFDTKEKSITIEL